MSRSRRCQSLANQWDRHAWITSPSLRRTASRPAIAAATVIVPSGRTTVTSALLRVTVHPGPDHADSGTPIGTFAVRREKQLRPRGQLELG
jgi:hypothetical protein